MPFSDFPLSPKLLASIADAGFAEPLPIQVRVVPALLEGRDVIVCSQTGSGKTAAFLIPIIEGLLTAPKARRIHPRALVLVPTRELAVQVNGHFEMLAAHTGLKSVAVFGGVDHGPQERALQDGVALVVATPGRLLEQLDRGAIKLRDVAFFVIDEADRLFDAGFQPEVRRVVDAVPERRQTMLFSATMPGEMSRFAHSIVTEPEIVKLGLVAPPSQIKESFWPVPEPQKLDLLMRLLAEEKGLEKVIVFVRQRARARMLAPELARLTNLPTAELHADLSQAERLDTIGKFRSGEVRLLVATDVASRGLDIEELTHVVNVDVPDTPDDYVHRVGRTGRVDRSGVAITLVSPRELALAASLEEFLRRKIPWQRLAGFPYAPEEETGAAKQLIPGKRRRRAAQPLDHRETSSTKKESPFTRSGKLKKKHTDADFEEKPRRGGRKRAEKKIKGKKLPHQRRK